MLGRARAYARWTLEPDAMQRLVGARARLDLRERMGLPHAIRARFTGGLLHGDATLAAFAAVADDPHPRVLAAWLSAVEDSWPMLSTPEASAGLRAWLARTLEPARRRLGIEPGAGEDALTRQVRADLLRLLGRQGRDPALLALARTKAAAILADPRAVDPDMLGTWRGLAAVEGDAVLFDAYVARHEALTNPADKLEYLRALAQFRDTALMRRALDFRLTDSVPPQEVAGGLFPLIEEPERGAFAHAWLKERYEDVAARIPPFMRTYPPVIASGCDVKQLQDGRAFFLAPERLVPGMSRTLDQAEDATRTCETVRAAERERVVAFVGDM